MASLRCLIHFKGEDGPLPHFSEVSFFKSRQLWTQWMTLDGKQRQVADETVDEDCLVIVCQKFFLQEGVSQMKIHGYYTDAAYQTTNYDDRAPEKGSTILDRRSCKLSLEKSGSHFPTRLRQCNEENFTSQTQ